MSIFYPASADDYSAALANANAHLDAELAAIREAQEAGTLPVREACDDRIRVLSAHLAALKLLRKMHFGDDA